LLTKLLVLGQAKVSDCARKQEMRTREELEVLLAATRKQHEELTRNKEQAATGLESAMERLALLNARTTTMNLRICEVAAELEVIQSSIETLRKEKSKVQNQEERHMDQVEGCRYRHATLPNCTCITCGGHSCSSFEACSRDRPELTLEVVRDLEQLHQKREKHIPSSFLCPISKASTKQEKLRERLMILQGVLTVEYCRRVK
jgi:chromosome segregation ATPase